MLNMLQQQGQQGNLVPITYTLSAQTTSIATQEMIEAKLERRHRNRRALATQTVADLFCYMHSCYCLWCFVFMMPLS